MCTGGHQLHPPSGHTRGPPASAAAVWRVQVGRGLQTCMRCLTMFRRQHYLIVYESVRGPMVRYLCQVCAPAAVAGQRGAGRRGDALPPLHTPRHGGHPAHHPHRLHAVGGLQICADMCGYYLYYLLSPSPGVTSSRPPPRCPRACGWPWWPGAAACR